jgi:iron complex outermembrane recepter protein
VNTIANQNRTAQLNLGSLSGKRPSLLALSVMMASATLSSGQIVQAQTEFALEEVMVTAQKREQNIQDVPLSVSTLSGESMDNFRSGGNDIRFLSGRTPSLVVESDFGRVFPRFYIRGIGNTDFDQNASQPVSLIYDDVVYENPMLKGFPVFDTDRVEVLRGPQGTLFGRNTPAGIVKLDSVKPSQEFDAYVKIGAGNFDTTDLEGAVGGALSNNWSGRISVLRQSRGDWARNEPSTLDPSLAYLDDDEFLEGYTETAYRIQLAYDSDQFSALFNVHGRDMDGTARLFRANIIKKGSNDFVDGYDRKVVQFDGENEQTVESTGGLAKLMWDFDTVTFTSITGYETVETFSRADVDGGLLGFTLFPAQTADGIPDHYQFTQELRLNNNNGDKLHWQTGLFYFDEHLEVETFNYADRTDNFDGYAHQEQDTKAWAVFAQADYDLLDDLTLTAGLRYSDDEKDYVAKRTTPLFGVGATLDPVSLNTSDSQVSGNLSVNYRLSDQLSVYSRFAKGFRAPSIQGRVLFSDSVTVADSETVTSFEVGVKSELLDNRVRLNASIYTLEISDQQLTAGSGTANANQLVNADKTKGQGVEVDLEWAITANLLTTLGVSYNDTEIQDSQLSVVPCGADCTVLDPTVLDDNGAPTQSVSINGNPLPRAPEWMSNFTLRYTVPLDSGDLYFQTDWAYRSEINFFLYESAEFRGDSLLEGGLRIGYTTSDDRYDFAAYGRNITDEDQLIGAIDFNNLAGIVNDPRTFGVEFTARF